MVDQIKSGWKNAMKKKRHVRIVIWIIVIHIFLLANFVSATSVVEWEKTFGEPGNDEAFLSLEETDDGGYIIAGKQLFFEGDSVSGEKALLIKTDANGDEVWSRTFGETGGSGSGATSVQQTRDKGYILAGYTMSSKNGDLDIWLIKTDENGNLIWSREFGGKGEDQAIFVDQTEDGGFILIGYKTSEYSDSVRDIWIIKTDENGTMKWDRILGGYFNEMPTSAARTSDGGFIIAAGTDSYGDGKYNGWLVKIDDNGIEQWNRTFGRDFIYSVQQTKDGGYILSGITMFGFHIMRASIYSGSDAFLIKTDVNGNVQWKKTFDGYMAWSVLQTGDNGFFMAGNKYPLYILLFAYDGDEFAWFTRTDAEGNKLWSFSPAVKNHKPSSLLQTENGSIVIAGSTDIYALGRKTDAWLLKLSEGVQTEKSSGFEWKFEAGGILIVVYLILRKNKS